MPAAFTIGLDYGTGVITSYSIHYTKLYEALLLFEKEAGGTVIDGIVWDMGERNLYDPKEGYVEGIGGRLRLPTEPLTGFT